MKSALKFEIFRWRVNLLVLEKVVSLSLTKEIRRFLTEFFSVVDSCIDCETFVTFFTRRRKGIIWPLVYFQRKVKIRLLYLIK